MKLRSTLCTVLYVLLVMGLSSSCAGHDEYSTEETGIDLFYPDSVRYILSLDDSDLWVDIVVNNRSPQSFRVDSTVSQAPIGITGVVANQINSLQIRWYEMFGGTSLPLTTQQYEFVADGNTVVDAPHISEGFDYDGDGRPNLTERLEKTCVWTTSEPCEVPVQTNETINSGSGENLLLNGDFTQGDEHWWLLSANNNDGATLFEEYCVSSSAADEYIYTSQFGYVLPLTIEANRDYRITFNVRAQTAGEMRFSLLDSINFRVFPIFTSLVQVSANNDQRTYLFENGPAQREGISLTFDIGGTDNTYCFDNMSLVRLD